MLFKFDAVFLGYKDNGKNAGKEDEKTVYRKIIRTIIERLFIDYSKLTRLFIKRFVSSNNGSSNWGERNCEKEKRTPEAGLHEPREIAFNLNIKRSWTINLARL